MCWRLLLSCLSEQYGSVVFPHSPPKPQFASWLIEQVETGQYKGLCYVDQNKFRVPWKHNSRKDCNDEDSKIFRVCFSSSSIFDVQSDKQTCMCVRVHIYI